MFKSFGLVEEKLFETEFFYKQLCLSTKTDIESKYYFSAFVSAARSVTFTLQATLSGVDNFSEWYETERNNLKVDTLASFFVNVRNDIVHKGANPLNQVPLMQLQDFLSCRFSKEINNIPFLLISSFSTDKENVIDARDACKKYLVTLIKIIFNCYNRFLVVVDSRWYFTRNSFISKGQTINDALEELGYPRDWLNDDSDAAWRSLRKELPVIQLNELFLEYINLKISDPDELS